MSGIPSARREVLPSVDLGATVLSATKLPKRRKGKALPLPITPAVDNTSKAIACTPRSRSRSRSPLTNESPSPIADMLPPPVEFGGPVINAVVSIATSPKPKKNKRPPPVPIDLGALPAVGCAGDDVIDLATVDAEIKERMRGLAELQALRNAVVAQQAGSPIPRPRRMASNYSKGSEESDLNHNRLQRQNSNDSGRGSAKSDTSNVSRQSEGCEDHFGDGSNSYGPGSTVVASPLSTPPKFPQFSPPGRVRSLTIPVWDPAMGPPPPPPDDPPPIAPPRRSKTLERPVDLRSLNISQDATEANRLAQSSKDITQEEDDGITQEEDNGPVYEDIDDVLAEMRNLQSLNDLGPSPAALNNGNETFELVDDALHSSHKGSDHVGRSRGLLSKRSASNPDQESSRGLFSKRSFSNHDQEKKALSPLLTRRTRSSSFGSRSFFGRRKTASVDQSDDPSYCVTTP